MATIAICLMGSVNDIVGSVAAGGSAAGVSRYLGVGGIGMAKVATMAGETVSLGDGDHIVAVGW